MGPWHFARRITLLFVTRHCANGYNNERRRKNVMCAVNRVFAYSLTHPAAVIAERKIFPVPIHAFSAPKRKT